MRNARFGLVVVLAFGLLLAPVVPAGAAHSWGPYHWARTSNPFSIDVIDSVTSDWNSRLSAVNNDWNQSTKMDNVIIAGADDKNTRRRCPAASGRIRVCNNSYGFNGWLGIATIHITTGSHIADGTTKVNDSYFGLNAYNTEAARRHVLCQEIGHDFGLDHQDGVSCMDDNLSFINDPAYVSPNAHDYDQLNTIYTHLDSFSTVAASVHIAPTTIVESDATGTTVTTIFWADPDVTIAAILADPTGLLED